MYSKLSLDEDVDLEFAEEESPSTKEFLHTTSALLRTLGERLVEKIDQISFLQEENILLKTTMKTEMKEMKDENACFKQYICRRFEQLNEEINNVNSSSLTSVNLSSSASTPVKSSKSPATTPTPERSLLELKEEVKFLKYEMVNKTNIIEYLMDARRYEANQPSIIVNADESSDNIEDTDPSPPPYIEDEYVHDNTVEIVERLLVEMDNQSESLVFLNVDDASEVDIKEKTLDGISIDGNQDLDENVEPDILEVAPWEKNGNGFPSKYMRKNGHQPGKGLGKSENGIAVPISVEKKTFQSESETEVPQHVWKKGTVLIAGASIIQGLDETRMSRYGKIKVRAHGGATIRDMHDHLNAILRKKPERLILHVHSNDASNKAVTSDDLFDGLMELKNFAESKVPGIMVIFSCPILRTDNSIANAKQIQLKHRLKRSGLDIIENDDIKCEDLGKKGLHLKPSGSTKLAKNILQYLKNI